MLIRHRVKFIHKHSDTPGSKEALWELSVNNATIVLGRETQRKGQKSYHEAIVPPFPISGLTHKLISRLVQGFNIMTTANQKWFPFAWTFKKGYKFAICQNTKCQIRVKNTPLSTKMIKIFAPFQTKVVEIFALFQTKTAQKPPIQLPLYHWGWNLFWTMFYRPCSSPAFLYKDYSTKGSIFCNLKLTQSDQM